MQKRPNLLVLLGLAVFVLGTAMVLLVVRDDGGDEAVAAPRTGRVTPAAGGGEVPGGGSVAPAPEPIAIPDGKRGVAVRTGFVPGVAGYVAAGDHVDVYASMSKQSPARVKLVLPDVEVLDVSIEVAPRRSSAEDGERPSGSEVTYLLALDPVQAERVIFLTSNESLYLTLVPKGAPPVATPGRTYDNVLGQ